MPRRSTQEDVPVAPAQTAPAQTDDAGQADMQAKRDADAEKGHFGEKPPGPDNSEYTLQTGADSPSALDASVTAAERRAKQLRESGSDAR